MIKNIYVKYTLFALLFSVIFTLINFSNSIYSQAISSFNIIATLLYFGIWIGFSFLAGKKHHKSFICFSLIYWIVNLIIFIVNYCYGIVIFYPIIIVNLTPMYGLSYFINFIKLPYSGIILILFVIILTIIGYIIGVIFSKNKRTNKTI